jgi:hypothetical protein
MWYKHLAQVATTAGLTVTQLQTKCEDAGSYSAFKKDAATIIRTRDINEIKEQAQSQSTLQRYLQLLDPSLTMHPNRMQPYLSGPRSQRSMMQLKFRSSTAPVRHREAVTRQRESSQCPCCQHADETCQHVVVECPQYVQLRRQLGQKIKHAAGMTKLQQFCSLSSAQKFAALIGDCFDWGDSTEVVKVAVGDFLVDVMEARQLAIRGLTAAIQPDAQAGSSAGPHGQQHA